MAHTILEHLMDVAPSSSWSYAFLPLIIAGVVILALYFDSISRGIKAIVNFIR